MALRMAATQLQTTCMEVVPFNPRVTAKVSTSAAESSRDVLQLKSAHEEAMVDPSIDDKEKEVLALRARCAQLRLSWPAKAKSEATQLRVALSQEH